MADNNDDAVDDAAAEEDVVAVDQDINTVVNLETKIQRLHSDHPKETLFSITFDNFEDLSSEKGHVVNSSEFSCFGS